MKEILSKFKDGEKRFETDPFFHATVSGLKNGYDPIKLLDQLCSIIDNHNKKIKQALDSLTIIEPEIWTEYIEKNKRNHEKTI